MIKKISQSLRKEVALVILVKVLFILGLWWVCFSHPMQGQITPAVMQHHLIDANARA